MEVVYFSSRLDHTRSRLFKAGSGIIRTISRRLFHFFSIKVANYSCREHDFTKVYKYVTKRSVHEFAAANQQNY